jgi:hypothetical protein
MEKLTYKNMDITVHPMDGFTLSYRDGKGRYFKQRYIGYSVREAKKLFKKYVQQEAINV